MGLPEDPFDSPIVPIMVGEADETLALRDRLLAKGFLTGAVRPPTVPRGTSWLRVSLHSGVADEDLTDILSIIRQWKNQ